MELQAEDENQEIHLEVSKSTTITTPRIDLTEYYFTPFNNNIQKFSYKSPTPKEEKNTPVPPSSSIAFKEEKCTTPKIITNTPTALNSLHQKEKKAPLSMKFKQPPTSSLAPKENMHTTKTIKRKDLPHSSSTISVSPTSSLALKEVKYTIPKIITNTQTALNSLRTTVKKTKRKRPSTPTISTSPKKIKPNLLIFKKMNFRMNKQKKTIQTTTTNQEPIQTLTQTSNYVLNTDLHIPSHKQMDIDKRLETLENYFTLMKTTPKPTILTLYTEIKLLQIQTAEQLLNIEKQLNKICDKFYLM